MNSRIQNPESRIQQRLPLLLLAFFILHSAFCLPAHAAQVLACFTNSVMQPDTNVFLYIPKDTNAAAADGSFRTIGLPIRVTPAADGRATNTLAQGHYLVTNAVLGRGFMIRVPNDTGATLYCATCGPNNNATNLAISGYNTYVTIVYGTNPAPTFDGVTNALGFLPLTALQTTNASSNFMALNALPTSLWSTSATLWLSNLVANGIATNSITNGLATTNFVISQDVITSNAVVNLTTGKVASMNGFSTNQSFFGNTTNSATNYFPAGGGTTFRQTVGSGAMEWYSTDVGNILIHFDNDYVQAFNLKLTGSGIPEQGTDAVLYLNDNGFVTANGALRFDGANLRATNAIIASNLTASRVLVSGAEKQITNSVVTTTELGYVSGVTSALQTQLIAKQPASANLTNWSTLATNAFYNTNANVQAGSLNLTNFSGLTTNAFYNTNRNLQAGSENLTNFSALTTNAFYNTNRNLQAGSENLTNWSSFSTNQFIRSTNGVGTNTTLRGGTTIAAGGTLTFADLLNDNVAVFDNGVLTESSIITTLELESLNGIDTGVPAQDQFNRKINTTNGIATNSFTVKGNLSVTTNATVNNILTAGGWLAASNATASRVAIWDANAPAQLTNSAVTSTELGRLSGVTGGVQTNIDARVPNFGGKITNAQIYGNNVLKTGADFQFETYSGERVVSTDADGKIIESATTATQLGYLDATSSIQGQFSHKLNTTNGIATNGFTVKGNLSVTTNIYAGSVTVTNAQTNLSTIRAQDIISISSSSAPFILSNNAAATAMRLSTSITNTGTLALIQFDGMDSASNKTTYASIVPESTSTIDGLEAGKVSFLIRSNTATPTVFTIDTNGIAARNIQFNGSMLLSATNLTSLVNSNNNIAPGDAVVCYITSSGGSPTATFNINGIQGGTTWKKHIIVNATTNSMNIINDSGFAAANADRFKLVGDIACTSNSIVGCIWDPTDSRWRVEYVSTGATNVLNGSFLDTQFETNVALQVKIKTNATVYGMTNNGNLQSSGTNFGNYTYTTNVLILKSNNSLALSAEQELRLGFNGTNLMVSTNGQAYTALSGSGSAASFAGNTTNNMSANTYYTNTGSTIMFVSGGMILDGASEMQTELWVENRSMKRWI